MDHYVVLSVTSIMPVPTLLHKGTLKCSQNKYRYTHAKFNKNLFMTILYYYQYKWLIPPYKSFEFNKK